MKKISDVTCNMRLGTNLIDLLPLKPLVHVKIDDNSEERRWRDNVCEHETKGFKEDKK